MRLGSEMKDSVDFVVLQDERDEIRRTNITLEDE
jgi:hypothetical protein